MKDLPINRDILNRRELLRQSAAGLTAGLISLEGVCAEQAQVVRNAIQDENQVLGTTDWQLTYTRVDPTTKYRCPWIEGYVSRASLRTGDILELFVSTNPPAEFKVNIYRLGYYGGKGGRHMLTLGPFDGITQPDPPVGENRVRECRWKPASKLTIPADWPSGVYLGKLSLGEQRYESYVIFIVRDDRPADVVFQCSDNTWQAYNRWPNSFSLYDNGLSPWNLVAGINVSYDRPYGKYCQVVDAALSQGSGEFLLWEFPLAYWLEKQGYDVTYCSNIDVHADPICVARGKVFLSVGHDEYWSLEQFRHVQAAVNSGVSVGFLSGNTCCFVAPLSPNSSDVPNRVLTRAGRFGGVSDAEQGLMGPFPLAGPNESSLIGARSTVPFNGSGDWVITEPSHWLFAGTGMKRGEHIPGLVGWEFHGDPAHIPGLQIVGEGQTLNSVGQRARWASTVYPGPKNNWVFNAATIFWSQGLSAPPGHVPPLAHDGRPHGPDQRVQQITANFFKQCGVTTGV